MLPLYDGIVDFAESKRGAFLGKVLGYLLQIGIITYLLYELTQIGWGNFFEALPGTPLFYLLFLVLYSALPISEIFSYRQCWAIRFFESLPVFIKKRVYNKTLIGYSGEVVVFSWARKKKLGSEKEIFKVIRDNNIVSSLASTTVVFGLLIAFIVSGKIAFLDYITTRYDTIAIVSTFILVVILAFVAYRNRRYFFSMPARIAIPIFSIHAGRMILINFVQVLQWYVVMPEVSWDIWFTFLSVQLIISRIPFLPNRDLFYIGASLELSNVINISSAAIAGLLVAQNVLDKLLNALLFMTITTRERKAEKPEEIGQS